MKLQNFAIGLLLVVATALGTFIVMQDPATGPVLGNISIQKSTTQAASTTVSTTAVKVLSANTGRISANVCNTSSSPMFAVILPGAYTTVTSTVGAANYFTANSGKTLGDYGCYTIDSDNMNFGAIWAIRPSGSGAVSSEEVTAQ